MSPFDDVKHLMKGRTIARIVFDAETIAARVRELGREIGAAYPDGDLLVLGLLKGSFIFLRKKRPDIPRPFRTPFVPLVPILGALFCVGQMASLPVDTWLRLLIWMYIGFLIYFIYSVRNSVVQSRTIS